MIVASIWAEGLHGGPCQPAAAIPTLNQEWESERMSLLLGKSGRGRNHWEALWCRSKYSQGRTLSGETKLQKLMLPQHLGSNPNPLSSMRWQEQIIWSYRTCLILPVKSRGSPRSHIRSCWSSSRVTITKLAGLKWIKERHSCFLIHLPQLCVGLCVYVRLSANTQQLFWVVGSLLLPGATRILFCQNSKTPDRWGEQPSPSIFNLWILHLRGQTPPGFNVAERMNGAVCPIKLCAYLEFSRKNSLRRV